MVDLFRSRHGDIVPYDPDRGLEAIAVAEIGEKYWIRAKDPTRLFEAFAQFGAIVARAAP